MKDNDGQQLAYVHFDDPRSAAKPLTRDEARRIAANIAKLAGAIAANIPYLSAHLATSRVLDPLQCPVLGLGEGDETALQSKRRTSQIATSQDDNAEALQCAKGRTVS